MRIVRTSSMTGCGGKMEFETVENVPAGLISCRLGAVQAHILRLSPRGMRLRIAEPWDRSLPLSVRLYRADGGMDAVDVFPAWSRVDMITFDVRIDDDRYAACVRRALRLYAAYVAARSEEDWDAAGALFGNVPPGDQTAESVAEQYERWFAKLPAGACDFPGKEIYVSLHSPELWNCYLATEGTGFWDAYAELRHIPRAALPKDLPKGVCIGSEYCRHLFPEERVLVALMEHARENGAKFALATCEGQNLRFLGECAKAYQPRTEVLINDWGMLGQLKSAGPALAGVLGTRLNRRRKDPRMGRRHMTEEQVRLLSQSDANDSDFRALMAQCGIERYEYEACGLPNAPVAGRNSLHLPMYHTNASRRCTLKALCARGDRGLQMEGPCPIYCEDNACLYPEHYGMIGLGNTIAAFDGDFAAEAASTGYDRIVLNF